ncbi:MAG: hypothetical protein HY817_04195 [Candidatus Abawacabacteria bacterium]|nr:hypothetical protein [Candidatus Abawacabacteria bacterium]
MDGIDVDLRNREQPKLRAPRAPVRDKIQQALTEVTESGADAKSGPDAIQPTLAPLTEERAVVLDVPTGPMLEPDLEAPQLIAPIEAPQAIAPMLLATSGDWQKIENQFNAPRLADKSVNIIENILTAKTILLAQLHKLLSIISATTVPAILQRPYNALVQCIDYRQIKPQMIVDLKAALQTWFHQYHQKMRGNTHPLSPAQAEEMVFRVNNIFQQACNLEEWCSWRSVGKKAACRFKNWLFTIRMRYKQKKKAQEFEDYKKMIEKVVARRKRRYFSSSLRAKLLVGLLGVFAKAKTPVSEVPAEVPVTAATIARQSPNSAAANMTPYKDNFNRIRGNVSAAESETLGHHAGVLRGILNQLLTPEGKRLVSLLYPYKQLNEAQYQAVVSRLARRMRLAIADFHTHNGREQVEIVDKGKTTNGRQRFLITVGSRTADILIEIPVI